MSRSPLLLVSVVVSAAIAGGLVLVVPAGGDVDPRVAASLEASPAATFDESEPTAAGPVAMSATDFAPPRGVVDPPVGHVARRDADERLAVPVSDASPDRTRVTAGR